MTKAILSRDIFDGLCNMEYAQNSMRITCDIGQELCSRWHSVDTAEENGRLVERMHVLLSLLQDKIKANDDAILKLCELSKEVQA